MIQSRVVHSRRRFRAAVVVGPAIALAAVVAISAPAHATGATYYPSGPQTNVPVSTVTDGGWTLCWSETYDLVSDMPGVVAGTDDHSVAPCNGEFLLLTGWHNTDSSVLVVLAAAPGADVFTETPLSDAEGVPIPRAADGWGSVWGPAGNTNPHLSNGTYWYYTPGASMGFTPTADLEQFPGDAIWADGTQPQRMSWHMFDNSVPDSIKGGYSLGLNDGLNTNSAFTRAIYTAGDLVQPEPTETPSAEPSATPSESSSSAPGLASTGPQLASPLGGASALLLAGVVAMFAARRRARKDCLEGL